MFKGVGFFHFAVEHDKPIRSLRGALLERPEEEVLDSLVVLPEAFNIRRPYSDNEPEPDTDPGILAELSSVSECFKVAFVAGLIIRGEEGVNLERPYSAAYLIDARFPIDRRPDALMCYKAQPDDTCRGRLRNYTPYGDERNGRTPDKANPIQHRGALIAAAICVDFHDISCGARPWLIEALDRETDLPRIFCIPASTGNRCLPFNTGEGHYQWKNTSTTVVLANSDRDGDGSFFTNSAGKIEMEIFKEKVNKVCVRPL